MKPAPTGPRPLLAGLLLLAGCASSPDSIDSVSRTTAEHHLDLAQAELDSGERRKALDRLLALNEVRGLAPEERSREVAMLERCVDELTEEMRGEGFDSGDLVALWKLDLTPQLEARVGILAAARRLEEGNRRGAMKMILRVDRDHSAHGERTLAGQVVARAGLSMARDPGRYYLIFRYASRGLEALEYLVVQYPFDEHCPEAYAVMVEIYAARGDLDRAIERAEDLLIYHPTSPYAVRVQARLPVLRMQRLERDDFDRDELVLARDEVEAWLAVNVGHELYDEVQETRLTCARRLAESDLVLARYYERIANDFGARLHAERALETAVRADLDEQASEAREILGASSPPEDGPGEAAAGAPAGDAGGTP